LLHGCATALTSLPSQSTRLYHTHTLPVVCVSTMLLLLTVRSTEEEARAWSSLQGAGANYGQTTVFRPGIVPMCQRSGPQASLAGWCRGVCCRIREPLTAASR
jgi:hypothetical protein